MSRPSLEVADVIQAQGERFVDRYRSIGSGTGDCAPAPSHTTGRTVFRIRRLDPAAYLLAARSDGITNP